MSALVLAFRNPTAKLERPKLERLPAIATKAARLAKVRPTAAALTERLIDDLLAKAEDDDAS